MLRQAKTKPKPKSQPYSTSKGTRQSRKKSSTSEINSSDLSNHNGDLGEQPVQSQSSPNASVISELSQLKQSINSMSNMLGSFLSTMSSLVNNSNIDNISHSGSSQIIPNLVVNQPQSVNSLDHNLGHGSNEQFVNMQGQPESIVVDQTDSNVDNDVQSNNKVMQSFENETTPETILQQAVNDHIANVTDLSHHPPGKRFQVIGRLLDRRVSDKLKKDIWENKYIDLHSLLPQEDKEEAISVLAPGKPGEHAKWQESKVSKGKLTIDEWCQAFYVYISVYQAIH